MNDLNDLDDLDTRMTLRRHRCISAALVIVLSVLSALSVSGCASGPDSDTVESPAEEGPRRHLLIVLDGLRPDYVTPELMPNLHSLGERGVVFTNHHAVFPTVTRVNASSIATGAYPESHGLLGNLVFFPAVDPARFLNSGVREDLLSVQRAEEDRLLTAPTLGEQLQGAGLSALVVSAGSTGSSFLLNHTVAGGGIIHYDYALPAALGADVVRTFGEVPPADTPNDARNRYVVDAFFELGIPQIDPAVTLMWLSEPDASAHAHGIGHPTTLKALERLDTHLGEIQQRLAALGWLDDLNVWVTSDHGFSTHTGAVELDALVAPFNGTLEDGSPRIVARGGAIYVRDGDQATVAEIVAQLQRLPNVGAIFTRGAPSDIDGSVPGTLSFELARWGHERAAAILFSGNWTDAENEFGYRGTSAQGGVAGHGSSSPFDIHNTLIAAGPLLKSGVTIDVPSGNVDFSPTFLSLLGLEVPSSMQGRVLREAFAGGPDPASLAVESTQHTVESEDGRYRLTASTSSVDGRRYLDYTEVVRAP